MFFFIAGRHPELSLAEIKAFLKIDENKIKVVGNESIKVKMDEPDFDALMQTLGGVIKTGEIIFDYPGPIDNTNTVSGLEEKIINISEHIIKSKSGGKFNFGVSVYSKSKNTERIAKKIGATVKEALKNNGFGARFVPQKTGSALSSVQVDKNKLCRKGAEFVILEAENQIYVGITKAVQPYEDYGARDFGRPMRDAKNGMLPPKLARIMVNLAGRHAEQKMILDPFCGSGTILTEAALVGWKNIYGSDISKDAINATKENFEWTLTGDAKLFNMVLKTADARNITKTFEGKKFDAIVAEPYLGSPLKGKETNEALQKQAANLSALYIDALKEIKKNLAEGGKIVIAFPVFISKNGFIETITPKHFTVLGLKVLTPGLLYMRPGQHLGRRIWVLSSNVLT